MDFASDAVQHNVTQRLLKAAGVAGGTTSKISYTYDPVSGVEGCVYDVKCLDAGQVAALNNPTYIDPTNTDFNFNSLVQYECPRAMEFRINAALTQPKMSYICQWNNTWNPAESPFPSCECELTN